MAGRSLAFTRTVRWSGTSWGRASSAVVRWSPGPSSWDVAPARWPPGSGHDRIGRPLRAAVISLARRSVLQQLKISAVVPWGGSGIGLDVARPLLAAGATVTIVGRSAQRLQQARSLLESEAADPARLHDVSADMSVEGECQEAIAAATAVTGELQAVVACAGGAPGQMAPVTELDHHQWGRVFDHKGLATMTALKYG